MTDPALGPFEPRLVRQRKRRARGTFRDASFLHARVVADLADRLEVIPRPFPRLLALGGGGLFSEEIRSRPELSARIGSILETDLDFIDPEHLPFAPGSFELIVSPLALHWINDLPGALIQLRVALKPDGLLLASLFGGDTLSELRLSLIEAESELTGGAGPRVSPFADLQDIAGLLQRAGFALPAADRDVVTVRYGEPMKLLADLRAMGETSALRERNPRALSRRVLARAFEIYHERFSDEDSRVRATFEILTVTGWSPHESQQKPLKPGSAKTRLADALKTTEHRTDDKANPTQ
ncbi:MAG: methyltransferase domain-containing protein [Terricaulis sp.]